MENIISFILKVTSSPFTTAALSSDDAQTPDKTNEQVIQTEDTQVPPPAYKLLEA